jgi:L-seryl-tRNA(Ser) seleniumtransferase
VAQGESTVGGGSLPAETLPTTLLVLPRSITAAALRAGTPAVIGRTQGRSVLLDLRTVLEDQENVLLERVCAAAELVDRPKNAVLESGAE